MEDLQRTFEQLARGERVELGAKTSSYQQWAESLQEYADSGVLKAEQSYWEQVWQEPVWRLPGRAGGNQVKQMRVVRQVLSAKETRALLQDVPGTYHTQIQEVLLTALAEALGRWSGAQRVVVEVEGHGREELHRAVDVTRTVGWFTTIYPVVLETAAGESTGDRLKQIKEQVRRVPKHGIGYGVLRYLKRTLSAGAEGEISFNYLGQFDQVLIEDGLLAGAAESAGEGHSPEGERRYKVEVGASVAGGQLHMSWSYSREQLEEAEMERVAEWYMQELREIIRHCAEPAAGGYTPSDFPLAYLEQRQLDKVVGRYKDLEDIYPMTPMQQGILYHILYAPESSLYITQITCTIHEALNIDAFEHAWQKMIDRHSMLRTAFLWHGLDDPLQAVSRTVKLPLQIFDWQTLSPTQQQTELDELLLADRARGFELAQAPLLRLFLSRLSPDSYHFIWSTHHLLLDGWSVPLLLQEVFALYEAGCRGETLDLEQPRPFRDYIVWLKRQDMNRAEAYWRRALAGFSTPTQLSMEHGTNGNGVEKGFAEEQMLLSADQSEQLQRFARDQQVTVNTVVQGVWALLLSRYSGEEDVLFGATVSGRPAELAGIEQIVGMFINSLPVRVRVRRQAQIGPWLRELQVQVMELRQYEYSPLVKVQNWSELRRGINLFDSLVVFDNYPVGDALKESGKRVKVENAGFTEQNNYPLTLTAATVPDLLIRMGYDRQRFETNAILRLLDGMKMLLNQIPANPDAQISDIKQVLIEADMKNQTRARIVQDELSRNKFMTVKPKPVRLATLGSS
jgi:non-ribosomal peptide synthase protein (TIGR01720 family)